MKFDNIKSKFPIFKQKINGKPLIYYTIKQCIEAGIENIYTSSDSEEILEIASDFGSKKTIIESYKKEKIENKLYNSNDRENSSELKNLILKFY